VDRFVTQYNTTRLHSAIGYVTPWDMLEGRRKSIPETPARTLEDA
jgi:transposase InsO family protein